MAKLQISWGWIRLRGIWAWWGRPWVMSPGNRVAVVFVFRFEKVLRKAQNADGFEARLKRTKVCTKFKLSGNFPHIQAVTPVPPSQPPWLNRQSITPLAICETFQTSKYVRLFVSEHKTQLFEEKANATGSADKNEKTSEPCTLTTHNWIKLQIIALNDCEVIFREFRNTLRWAARLFLVMSQRAMRSPQCLDPIRCTRVSYVGRRQRMWV